MNDHITKYGNIEYYDPAIEGAATRRAAHHDALGGVMNEGRRIAIVAITLEAAAGLLCRGRWRSDLPDDATVVWAEFDAGRMVLRLFVASDTFPPVAEGAPIPQWQPTITTIWEAETADEGDGDHETGE